jgi:hypothetical protein
MEPSLKLVLDDLQRTEERLVEYNLASAQGTIVV